MTLYVFLTITSGTTFKVTESIQYHVLNSGHDSTLRIWQEYAASLHWFCYVN